MKRFPFIRIGLIFAFSPILLAFVTSLFQGGSMWDEGNGTGAYIWLMFLTLPVGFLLVVIGLVMAVVRRTRKGRSPFAPDKEHLHHRLLKLGHGQERAVLIMTAFTGLLAFGAVSTAFVPVWVTGLGAGLGVVALASWVLNPPRTRTRART